MESVKTMGEEQIQEQPQEVQPEEEQPQEEPQPVQETNLVRHLRKELEKRIKREKELLEELQKRDELLRIANVDEIVAKLNKVDELEFQLNLAKNYPQFADKVDEIVKERKPGETVEETLARYLGKQQLTSIKSSTVASSNIAPNLQGADITSLPPEERERIAKGLFKQVYGRE